MNLHEMRQKFPQYDDVPDEQFVAGVHRKFYSDIDRTDFNQRIGFGSTDPATDERIAGPKRPTFADVDLTPSEHRQPGWFVPGGSFAGGDQVEMARAMRPAMTKADSEKTLQALAVNEANQNEALGSGVSPMGYGVTGTIAPHLWDKGMSYIDDKIYDLTSGNAGQPYDEAVATRRVQRDRNWEENPIETAIGGAGSVLALPAVAPFGATTKAGHVANAATTGSVFGGLHGAGRGDTLDEGLLGAVEEGGLGAAGGALVGKLTQRLRPQGVDEKKAILSARRANVEIPEAVASDSFRVQQEAGLLSKIPVAGVNLQKGLNRAVDDVETGVKDSASFLASQAGRAQTGSAHDVGSDAVQHVIGWVKKTSQEELAKRLVPLEKSINPGATSVPINVANIVKKLRNQDYRSASSVNKPAIDSVVEAITREGGLDYRGFLDLRTNIGALMHHDMVTQGGTSQPAFKQIYGALTRDIRNHVGRNSRSGAKAVKQFDDVMSESSKILRRRDQIQKILGKNAELNPEKLVNSFGGWIKQGGRESYVKLEALRRVAGDDVISDLFATHLTRAVDLSGKIGEFSLGNFDKVWKGIPTQSKSLLANLKGARGSNKGVIQKLDALSETVDNIQKVIGEANHSRTAYANILWDKLHGAANVMQKAGSLGAAIGTGAVGATGAAMGAATTTAASAALPFLLGRWVANSLAKPASIRNLNGLLRAGAQLTRAQEPGGYQLQRHVNTVNLALQRIAFEIAKEPDVKRRRIGRKEIEQYLGRELLPPSQSFSLGAGMSDFLEDQRVTSRS